MPKTPATNTLYYGDNLDILREYIEDDSVDLVYLDPPFNSNATDNVLFRAPSGDEGQARFALVTQELQSLGRCATEALTSSYSCYRTNREQRGTKWLARGRNESLPSYVAISKCIRAP